MSSAALAPLWRGGGGALLRARALARARGGAARALAAKAGAEAEAEAGAKGGADEGPGAEAGRTDAGEFQEKAGRAFSGFAASARGYYERARADAARVPLRDRATGALRAAREVLREEYIKVMQLEDVGSATARRAEVKVRESEGADVLVVEKRQSAWDRGYEDLKTKVRGTALFQKLSELGKSEVFRGPLNRANEFAEDMREKWETSDNPYVHKLQDMQDSLSLETDTAKAYRVIRERDPDFEMPKFLAQVERDIPVVMNAYLSGDLATLERHVTKEMVERMAGQIKVWQSQGQEIDKNILDIGDVEVIEVKTFEDNPMVILRFAMQQVSTVLGRRGGPLEKDEED